jgi:DNA polymerase III epsilon subunit family exonuclease
MKPERQFWLWVLALCVGMFALVGVQVWLFQVHHREALRALPREFRANLLLFLAISLLSLLPFLVWGMRVWYRRYVLPLHRLSEDVEALVYGSPEARVGTDEDDPAGLAPLLNALMERYQHGEHAVEERLESTLGELSAEKSRLESLLEALSEGVIVTSPEGRVLRSNRAARQLFGDAPELGVGKPLEELVDAALFDFARERLQEQLATGVARPHTQFECRSPRLGPLRARIAPLLVYGGRLDGYVLTIEPPEAAGTGLPPAEAGERTAQSRAVRDWNGRPLADLRYLVFDMEATGPNPDQGDAVISLGAVVIAGSRIVQEETFDELVDPGRPVTKAAARVHGLQDADLAGRPPLSAFLPRFLALARGSVLVAHNAAFDMTFLRRAAQEQGRTVEQPVLDTMLLSAVLHPHQPSHSLDSLLARYGIAGQGRHTALGDALMTAELLLRLLPQLERRGIGTLGAALEACRRTPLARLSYER